MTKTSSTFSRVLRPGRTARRLLCLALLIGLSLTGCGQNTGSRGENPGSTSDENISDNNSSAGNSSGSNSSAGNSSADGQGSALAQDASAYFSDRDFDSTYAEKKSALITLNGDSASCSSNAVSIQGSTVTITDEGTYILRGTLDDGMIVVNSKKGDKTQLVLDGVSIHSETSAPIYILQSDKVFITLAEGSDNTLSNGGTFQAIDDNNIDAVLFSKDDVTLNGSGSLTITSPAGHGIVSKDSLTITDGRYDISSASHGMAGKDDVCIAGGTFTIVSGKDGIHAENNDDEASGFVFIQNGSFDISAEGDGISAASMLQISDGSFRIIAGGGSVNAKAHASDSWGNFMGGGMGGPGGKVPGGMGSSGGKGSGSMSSSGSIGSSDSKGSDGMGSSAGSSEASDTSDDSTSMKGIKAGNTLSIVSGTFTINSADDAVHSNTSAVIAGGTFDIATGDDAFHAEDTLNVTGGTIRISESYEGLEALHVNISAGDITLVAADDGLNAAGGTDSSGFGGRDGMGGPGGRGTGGMGMGSSDGRGTGGMSMGSSDGSITISGGTLNITASGDGIDANGTLDISGGHTIVSGPTQGDTATLDYDTRATISGGTFIGTGASNMAQTFSECQQGTLAVRAGNIAANTTITLTDLDGNVVLTHTPELPFNVIILSSPEVLVGETYTLKVGEVSADFTIE